MDLVHDLDALEAHSSLTRRQQEFCIQFILTNNKAEAARLAGYALNNSSSIGCRLLRREDIQKYIQALRVEAARRSHKPNVDDVAYKMASTKAEAVASMSSYFELSAGTLRLRRPDQLSRYAIDDLHPFEGIELDEFGRVVGYKLRQPTESIVRLIELADGRAEPVPPLTAEYQATIDDLDRRHKTGPYRPHAPPDYKQHLRSLENCPDDTIPFCCRDSIDLDSDQHQDR